MRVINQNNTAIMECDMIKIAGKEIFGFFFGDSKHVTIGTYNTEEEAKSAFSLCKHMASNKSSKVIDLSLIK